MLNLSLVPAHSGGVEENLRQYAKILGKEKVRRLVFEEICGRKSKPRSAKQIISDADIDVSKRKQVLNALEFLSSHGLIEKLENDGHVRDGSRLLYRKIEMIKANKKRIIRFADNREIPSGVPAMTQQVPSPPTTNSTIRRKRSETRKKLVVLYLTASPNSDEALRVDAEVRRVQQAIRSSKYRDKIQIEYRPAADIQSILDGLNDFRPRIVHFSGHSNADGIATDNQSVEAAGYVDLPYSVLAEALRATDDPPDVVVLNSCESSGAKSRILESAKVLVSMKKEISDIAAADFARQFYSGIASRQSIYKAFKQGTIAIMAKSSTEADTPEFSCSPTANAETLILM